MTGRLGQQSLLELAPTRRLLVPPGNVSWWGVDSSVKRVAIAAMGADGAYDVRTASFPDFDTAPRLSAIYAATRALAASMAVSGAGIVGLEQPGGNQRNFELYYATGVILMAVHDALVKVLDRDVRIERVVPAWWKKRACGRGDIYKPTRKQLGRRPVFDDYGVARWARDELGYAGDSWDEADTLGIATALRREVLLEVR